MKKVLIIVGIVLAALILIGGGFLFFSTTASWTPVDGEVKITGLEAEVKVVRNELGIPALYGESMEDLVFAQGFIHAQDRLWQMESTRQLCGGTMSSFIGPQGIPLDTNFRILGLSRVAEKSLAMLDEESAALLERYAEGVNAYIETYKNNLPIEYMIMGLQPRPWTPVDSLLVTNFMALNMGINGSLEAVRKLIEDTIGPDKTDQLFVKVPEGTPRVMTGVLSSAFGNSLFKAVDDFLGQGDVSWGSNNWVVHGSKTDTGKPYLANDTHMGLPMPSVWYENTLHSPGYQGAGFSIPGLPLIVIGHNGSIFWAITNLDPDVQDLYFEKSDDNITYEFMGETRQFEKIVETIEVKNAPPVTIEVLLTGHGPVVNTPLGITNWPPTTMRWNIYDGSTAVRSLRLLNKAQNWDEFREAVRYWDILSQNFLYADLQGNIGFQATGRVPIREKHHSGLLPMEGWTGENEWLGYIPFEEMPTMFNPENGFIVTANNKVTGPDYPYNAGGDNFPGYRAKRITDLLSAKDRFTLEDMQSIQLDTYSIAAEILLPYLTALEGETEMEKTALEYLAKWDKFLDVDSTGGALFETWVFIFIENVVHDDLEGFGEHFTRNPAMQLHVPMLAEWLENPSNTWFDDTTTEKVELRDDMIQKSFKEALAKLTDLMGNDISKWRWGSIHHTVFAHSTLGMFLPMFNEVIEAPGSDYTVNQAYSRRPGPPFIVIHGTSQRIIMDISNPDNTLAVNTTGQNGNIFHKNRNDMTALFSRGEYHTLPVSKEIIENEGISVLKLLP